MFDILLEFLEKNQVKLIEIYLKERKEKGEGLFTIIQDGNKADIRYYLPDKIPYEDISKEYNEKIKSLIINVTDKIKVNDNEVKKLMKLMDKDGSGSIDFNEFSNIMAAQFYL